MAWGRSRNMAPLESGSMGGGKGFAPSPGFPPGGRTRPPGAPPTVPGRRGGFQVPKFPPRRGPPTWKPKNFRDNARKFKAFQKGMEALFDDFWKKEPAPEWFVTPIGAGWTKGYDCVGSRVGWWVRAVNATASCGSGNNVPDGSSWSNIQGTAGTASQPIAAGRTEMSVWWRTDTSLGLTSSRQRFTRPAGTDFPFIMPTPGGKPRVAPMPQFWPVADPMGIPELQYGPSARSNFDMASMTGSKPAVDFQPGGPVGGKPGVHNPAPPKPPDKERKEPPFDYGAPGKIYGALTEAGDAAGCYIEAKGGDPGGKGTRGKFKEAWRLANDPDAPAFDPVAFGMCMAVNNAQDAVIGGLSNAAAKAQNRSGSPRPGGYRGGGWGTRMT